MRVAEPVEKPVEKATEKAIEESSVHAETNASLTRANSALVDESERVLRRHARSFRWAAPFLPPDARRDAAVTYAFCRFLDDAVDERASHTEARASLDAIERELRGERPARPLVAAYREIEARRGIPREAALELLAGLRMDLAEAVCIADDDELERYCFRVAGTVGLMMAPILGTTHETALRHAKDLGIAMQLTNICRDVAEDAARGRVYLPAPRLRAEGIAPEAILDRSAPPRAVLRVIEALLDEAEVYYASGRAGFQWLPFRVRLAIAVAARLYRAIGLRVRALGPLALERRAVVSPARKLGWLAVAIVDATATRAAGSPAPRGSARRCRS